jgi:hypothetical protein
MASMPSASETGTPAVRTSRRNAVRAARTVLSGAIRRAPTRLSVRPCGRLLRA